MGQSPSSDTYNTNGDGMPFYQGNADFGKRSPSPRVWCNSPKKTANEGDILINLRSDIPGNPPYHVSVGDAVCQGIFVQYGVTDDDDATELTREQRRGGLGSTGK